MAQAVFANFGLDEEKRALLVETLVEMVPVKGDPLAEWVMASSMCAGVLIGLLIADAGLPEHPATVPDCLPPNPCALSAGSAGTGGHADASETVVAGGFTLN